MQAVLSAAPLSGPAIKLGSVLTDVRRRFADADCATPGLDARLLVAHVLEIAPERLILDADSPVDQQSLADLAKVIARRAGGEPVHRILGWREFYGLRLSLSSDTLEPRPDTEVLVDAVLPHLHDICDRHGYCHFADIGTGTGAIALALLSREDRATALGTDISDGALKTACKNARTTGLENRFQTLCSDGIENLPGPFGLIVSNPPYIPSDELDHLDPQVRDFDPSAALDGGEDGLMFYRHLAAASPRQLLPGGIIAVEIGMGQSNDVTALFTSSGLLFLRHHKDLSNKIRVLIFQKTAW